MSQEHSFDVVCKLDKTEIANAIQQAERETSQRYDFKGGKYSLEFDQNQMTIQLTADSEFRLKSLADVLETKLAKRQIPLTAITRDKIETSSAGNAKQTYRLQAGIAVEKAKEIVKMIKDSKMKVQASIQSDQVRVSGKALDDLQEVQKLIRNADLKIHVQFVNYR